MVMVNGTYVFVIGAADGLLVAGGTAASANNGQRRAGEADVAGDVTENDAEEAQKGGHCAGVRL